MYFSNYPPIIALYLHLGYFLPLSKASMAGKQKEQYFFVGLAFLLCFAIAVISSHEDEALTDEIVVQFTDEDLNAIKSRELCSSDMDGEDCYLTFLPDAVRDAVGIAIEGNLEGQCLAVSQFTSDMTSPMLDQFVEFDYNAGLLILNFTEVIRTQSANFTAVRLQSSFDTFGETYRLRQGDIMGPLFSTNVTLLLHMDDLNELKRNNMICTSRSNCWIRFSPSFIVDIAGNSIEPAEDGDFSLSQRALSHVPDTTPPNVQSFTVNLNTAEVTFYFDETVVRSVFDPTRVTFSASENVSTNYTLTNARHLSSEEAVTNFTIVLDESDTIALKSMDDFFSSINDTFLTHDENMILDRFDNRIETRLIGINALQASGFTPDTTAPLALIFDILDMDQDRMQVSFNEPVNIFSINFTQIILRSGPLSDSSAVTIPLSGASSVRYVTTNKLTIEIRFNNQDIRSIKLEPRIAVSVGSSYLELQEGAIEDTSGVPNAGTPTALQAATHIRDSRGPELMVFILNLTSNTLYLRFSDVVDVSTLDVTEITLQADSMGLSPSTYTLTNSATSSPDGFEFTINLSDEDSNAIKAIPDLASNINNTYISITAEALRDIFGANVLSVIPSAALPAFDFIPDMSPPVLLTFDLDYNTETIVLSFDKTVDVASLDVTQITLQNTPFNATSSVTLTGGVVRSNRYVTSFAVELTRSDLNLIKFLRDLAVSEPTTYLSITSGLIADSNNNPVVEISSDSAQRVSNFTADRTPPVLLSFNLDVNTGQIYITFDETVLPDPGCW